MTDAAGHFGWDVVAGFYKVRAEKAGCVSPTNSSQAFAESLVLEVPPPVTDLDLRLDCGVNNTDTIPPSCDLTNAGTDANGHDFIQVTVQDIGSGLASVVTTTLNNATVGPFTLSPGMTDPLTLTFTKSDQTMGAQV